MISNLSDYFAFAIKLDFKKEFYRIYINNIPPILDFKAKLIEVSYETVTITGINNLENFFEFELKMCYPNSEIIV